MTYKFGFTIQERTRYNLTVHVLPPKGLKGFTGKFTPVTR